MINYFENLIKDFIKNHNHNLKLEFKISTFRLSFIKFEDFKKVTNKYDVNIIRYDVVLDTNSYNNIIIIEVTK